MNTGLSIALSIALAIVVGLNIYATFRIWRDVLLGGGHRIAQLFLVWILPIVGAVAALWYLREERFEARRFESPGPDSGDGMAL